MQCASYRRLHPTVENRVKQLLFLGFPHFERKAGFRDELLIRTEAFEGQGVFWKEQPVAPGIVHAGGNPDLLCPMCYWL